MNIKHNFEGKNKMDPTNNPIPTPTPTPALAPEPPVPPAAPGPLSTDSFDTPVAPATDPVTSVTPVAPVAPVAPEAPAARVTPEPAPAPVVSNPTAVPVNPVAQPSGAPVQPPVNPVVQPSGIGVTDPIMMPEQPEAPDPVEEELKAPMKAAGPVPGSIGSAVSGPASASDATVEPADNPFASGAANSTPSVPFNDPATQPENGAQPDASAKAKKTNKTTLIALIIVAAMVVIALAAVLIFSMIGGDNSGGGNQGGSSSQNQGSGNSGGGTSSGSGSSGTGDSGNSGSNGSGSGGSSNSGGSGDVSNVNGSIICTTSGMRDNYSASVRFEYKIVDNKLTTLDVDVTMRDENGQEITNTQSMTFEEMMASQEWTDEDFGAIGRDGTLSVTPAELAQALQDSLATADDGITSPHVYSCSAT